jgi:hypothetical protein
MTIFIVVAFKAFCRWQQILHLQVQYKVNDRYEISTWQYTHVMLADKLKAGHDWQGP